MDDYVRQLETLQIIREIAGGQLHLPQICVVGDQSSGKSSLLKLVTGVDFPVRAGTCTKAAIVVECKKQREEKYEIMEYSNKTNSREYIECDSKELSDKILECQEKMLNSGRGSKISEEEIKIKVGGSSQIDIIVVDLPGIINVGPEKEETRNLILKYIKPEQTLILLVSEAKTDAELISAVELSKKCDPDGCRTMSVLTKFDNFDSEDSRNRAVRWIVGSRDEELGAHAVIAGPDGKTYDEDKESEKLAEMKLPDSRTGIGALKARLPPLYAKLIQTNLPGLEEGILKKISDAEHILEEVGAEPVDGSILIKKCQAPFLDEINKIKEDVTPAIYVAQEAIHEMRLKITEKWIAQNFVPNAFEVPFFSGESAFKKCFAEISKWWQPVLDDYVIEVEKTIVKAIDKLEEVSIPQMLLHAVTVAWNTKCKELVRTLDKECKNELNKFKTFGTLNHYLTSEYKQELVLPEDIIKTFISMLVKGRRGEDEDEEEEEEEESEEEDEENQGYLRETRVTVEKKLKFVYKAHLAEFNRKSLHDQQKERLFAAVKAAYKVEKKTFTDLIMKATNIHVHQAISEWINTDLLRDERIKNAAKEDNATINKRIKALENIKIMTDCHDELKKIM